MRSVTKTSACSFVRAVIGVRQIKLDSRRGRQEAESELTTKMNTLAGDAYSGVRADWLLGEFPTTASVKSTSRDYNSVMGWWAALLQCTGCITWQHNGSESAPSSRWRSPRPCRFYKHPARNSPCVSNRSRLLLLPLDQLCQYMGLGCV